VSAKPWSAAFPRPRDEADPVGTMEGSRFTRTPFAGTLLNPPRLLGGRVRAGGSRECLPTSLQPTAIHFVYYQCNTIRPNRIVGPFREPPARQRLRNTTVVCTISSGYGQPSKAAPLQALDRSASQARQRSRTPFDILSYCCSVAGVVIDPGVSPIDRKR
jgi:hypothetical protein